MTARAPYPIGGAAISGGGNSIFAIMRSNSQAGFTVKEADEIWAAIRIFETAKTIPTLRHFVWSGMDYALEVLLTLIYEFLIAHVL